MTQLERCKNAYLKLPLTVIHGDLHLSNIDFHKSRAICVYDFETVNYGYRIQDFVRCCFKICFTQGPQSVCLDQFSSFCKMCDKKYPMDRDIKEFTWTYGLLRLFCEICRNINMLASEEMSVILKQESFGLLEKYLGIADLLIDQEKAIKRILYGV